MKKEVLSVLSILIVMSITSYALALSVGDSIPVQIQTTDSLGNIITGTFNFTVNISNSSSCTPVLHSNTTTKTTDVRGIVSYNLENVSLGFDEQYWFCYYRNGVIKETRKMGRAPYTFRAKNITLSGVEVDTNLNMGSYNLTDVNYGFFSYLGSLLNRITELFIQDITFNGSINGSGNISTMGNVTASYFIGDGSGLTGITATSTSWNRSGTNVFLHYTDDKVGIGTQTPTHKLNVIGNANITGNLTLGGEVTGQERSRMRATRGTLQTIPTGTVTIVQYNTEVYDNLGEYDNTTNYRFTANEAGYYLVTAATITDIVAWSANQYWETSIYKNGAEHTPGLRDYVDASVTRRAHSVVADIVYLSANDYIDIRILHGRGSDTNIAPLAAFNYFAVDRLKSPITIGGGGSGESLWTNVSGVATYYGNANITGNLTLGGEVTGQTRSRMRVTKDNAQTIPNNAWTLIEYDDKTFDNLGEYDNTTNYRFTATEAGYYFVKASFMSQGIEFVVDRRWLIAIFKNGVLYSEGTYHPVEATSTSARQADIVDIVYLAADDYIDIRVHHNKGATVDNEPSAVHNIFAVDRLKSPITIGGEGFWNLSGSNLFPEDLSYNVGIGTTSPDEKLAIYDATADAHITFGFDGDYRWTLGRDLSDGRFFIWQDHGGISSERLTIDAAGNVGIGTASPNYKFQINDSADTDGVVRIGGSIDYGDATVLSVAPGTVHFDAPGIIGGRMTINGSTGNVGIGTMGPIDKLSVKGSDVGISLIDSNNWKRFRIYINDSDDASTYFQTMVSNAWVDRMVIDRQSGNVGIGTTSPDSKLEVIGDVYPTAYTHAFSVAASGTGFYNWAHNRGTNLRIIGSLDQTGGSYGDYVTWSYGNINVNELFLYVVNHHATSTADFNITWIVVGEY